MNSPAPDLPGVRRTTVVDVPQRGPGDERGTTAVAARAHIVSQPAPANLSVGETAITETDIAREMQYHPAPTPQQSRAATARALVVRELLRREVERLGLATQAHPIGHESAEEACIRTLMEREVAERMPGEEDCRRSYDRNGDRSRSPDRIRVCHILLSAPRDDVNGRLGARREAERLIGELRVNLDLFAEFAVRYSRCPSKDQGGCLGWLPRVAQHPANPKIETSRVEGEVVAGIALARFGQNALDVIANIKSKLSEISAGLPAGVRLSPVYDRSELIYSAVHNLRRTLIEESVIVALVCIVFLMHARSALVAIVMLPIGILMAFTAMRAFGFNSNIMSLGGIAIAIGAMVDAAIVMIENAHKHLEPLKPEEPRLPAIVAACREVGPSLFYSLLIITVSFLPVFSLEAQEGRMFRPLALTKTFSMAGAALLSVTLVPVLMLLFIRGRIPSENKNPLVRALIAVYRPIITGVLRWKRLTLGIAVLVLIITIVPALRLGSEFMPTLNEGTILFMPSSLPGMSVTQAARTLQIQDRILKGFPEVESVFGKAGRANTATDPAPLEMFETVINLKPEKDWRPGMTIDRLIGEMDKAVQLPGISNAWTMPIKARLDMLSTGIRTPVGIKVFGTNLADMERLAKEIEGVVHTVPGTTSAYAERLTGGYYLQIEPDSRALGRYGLTVGDVHEVIGAALGGEVVTTTVEGRERFDVTVRYPRELRDSPEAIARNVLVPVMDGSMVPLGELAKLSIVRGPPSIRTENALLSAYIFVDIHGRDIGSYVADAKRAVAAQVKFPPGYYITWSGQFEYMQHAIARLKLLIPLTILIIFMLLYMNFGRLAETLIVMVSVPFAAIGGVWLMYLLGYNVSVAVAVGFIALIGVASETGVVMLIYLDRAWEDTLARCKAAAREPTAADLREAVMHGAVLRVRPKLMTVVAIMAGLLPIMWSTGTGSEIMRRIAAPMVGGMVSATILTLVVIPAVYALVKERTLKWPKLPSISSGLEG
jgi:copper/silver efflux system protein